MSEGLPICTFLVLAATVYVSYLGFKNPSFRDRYLFDAARILRDREFHRLITCGSLHLNGMHLLFNMFCLFIFGELVELRYGAVSFLVIYFASILGGALFSLYIHRHHEYRALGASGGVSGIIFAAIFLFSGLRLSLLFLPIPFPGWVYAIFYMLFSFFGMRGRIGNIGHDAHLGGALSGMLTATLLYPRIIPDNPVLYPVVATICVLMLVYSAKHPMYLETDGPLTRAYWRKRGAELRRNRAKRRQDSDEATLERLLAKISRSGMESLSPKERRRMKDIAARKDSERGT